MDESDLVTTVPADEISVVLDEGDVALKSDVLDLLSGEWIHVMSTNVEAIRYNLNDKTMDVEFQHGRYYKYYDVPAPFFVKFTQAHSPGGFVWDEIRRPNAYHFVKFSFGGGESRPTGSKLKFI